MELTHSTFFSCGCALFSTCGGGLRDIAESHWGGQRATLRLMLRVTSRRVLGYRICCRVLMRDDEGAAKRNVHPLTRNRSLSFQDAHFVTGVLEGHRSSITPLPSASLLPPPSCTANVGCEGCLNLYPFRRSYCRCRLVFQPAEPSF